MKEETQDSQQREYKETKPPKSVLLLVKSLIIFGDGRYLEQDGADPLLSVRCKELFDC